VTCRDLFNLGQIKSKQRWLEHILLENLHAIAYQKPIVGFRAATLQY